MKKPKAMKTRGRPGNDVGLTTGQVRLPPIRVDRRALDALCAAARTAIENATDREPEHDDLFDKPRVRFSARFQRGRWRHRETVEIDQTDIDRLGEAVRTTEWSVNARRHPYTASECSIRIHAGIGGARLIVTSRDAAWRRAATASILEVAKAHAPRWRWGHHWSARAGTGIAAALATATTALLTPSELGTGIDAALATFNAIVLGGWTTAIHTMTSNRRSHLLVLGPDDKDGANA